MRPAKPCTRIFRQRSGIPLARLTCAGLALVALAGCTVRPPPTPEERLRNHAAADAKQVHHDLRAAGNEAKHALVDARRETRSLVTGAREGWAEGKTGEHGGKLDLNHASASELEALPGVEPKTARRIVAARPYSDPDELWKHHLLTHAEFDRIKDRVATDE